MTYRIGPFRVADEQFCIESGDPTMSAVLDDRLRDLRAGADAEARERPDTVFTVERTGPAWMSHPWAVWRDGEPCEQTVTDSYVVPYVLWELTRLLLEGTTLPTVPMHAAGLVRDGRAVALIGPSHAGKSTLAAWLTRSGWGFLTDEVTLLDTSDPGRPVAHPFWRPIGIRRPSPLDPFIECEDDDGEILVPASELGRLADPSPLVALVCARYQTGASGELEPLSPAAALTMIADQLPSLGRDGGPVFRALASVVAEVPAFTLPVDDLDTAAATMAELVDGARGTGGGATSELFVAPPADPTTSDDGAIRPHPHESVDTVFLPPDVVVLDQRHGEIHHLNGSASAVWMLLDGETSAVEVANELSELYAAPVSQLQPDVDAAIDDFRGRGLLAGEHPDRAPARPATESDEPPAPEGARDRPDGSARRLELLARPPDT